MTSTRDQRPAGTPSNAAQGAERGKTGAVPDEADRDALQGEGNYEAAREFNEAERDFVESGKVPAAARAAAPASEEERKEMLEAEQAGKQRSKR